MNSLALEGDIIMAAQTELQTIDYTQALGKLIAKMHGSQVAQVYDFACFLQARPMYVAPQLVEDDDDDDWLNDSEEELQAEDAMWDAALSRHDEKFTALAEAALTEIKAGTTKPMFNKQGEFVIR
jgi:hypothetical protein